MSCPFDLPRIGAGLPVAQALPQLRSALVEHSRLVVQAPPGTGKTTLVPPAVANLLADEAGAGTPGKVIVCAPRRLAVRSAADRLRFLAGQDSPKTARGLVGHRMRGDSSPGTAVEFVTPAVLVRMLLSAPDLPQVGAIVIDEVHERHLDTDIALAFSLELAELRPELRVILMSATLPSRQLAALMGNCPVVETPATLYPVATAYAPHPSRLALSRRARSGFYEHLAGLADRQVDRTGHSALVFVPGAREVEDVVARCHTRAFPLHGRLDRAAQQAAMTVGSEPRVVVATAVAESSLTVPGVRSVIDSGLSRVPRRDAGRGMQGLITVSSAKATAQQRAGRAGREGPGEVVRAYSAEDYRHFAEHADPEIATADLTQAALWLAVWGTPRGAGLPLISPPPQSAIDQACATLRRIGATDERDAATPLGHRLASLPLDPRLGRALVVAGRTAAAPLAALAAGERGDLARAQAPAADVKRLDKIAAHAADRGGDGDRGTHGKDRATAVARRAATDPAAAAGVAVALAFPERVARREGPGEYLLASGTRAAVPHGSGVPAGSWLAVGEVTRRGSAGAAGKAGATIRSAARLSEEDALAIVGVTETQEAEWSAGEVRTRSVRRAGAIELSRTPIAASASIAADAIAKAIEREGWGFFEPSAKARALLQRVAFLHHQLGSPWPDPERLDPHEWFAPEIDQLAHGATTEGIDLIAAINRILPWPEAARLAELAPERLEVPSGSHPKVDYSSGRPVVRVKLQECFGLAESPVLAGARVQFRLLSPAGRELAVTDDLDSFWSGPYQQVRAEMRGRYPKHPWPQDPWAAEATAKTKKGRRG